MVRVLAFWITTDPRSLRGGLARGKGQREGSTPSGISEASDHFIQKSPELRSPDADPSWDLPQASLLAVAVAVEDGKLLVVWIGGGQALLVRDLDVARRAVPHTLREKLRRERPDLELDSMRVPNCTVRSIGRDASPDEGPEFASFDIEAGDTLVLLSKSSFRGPDFPVEDAAVAAAAFTSPLMLAEHQAERLFQHEAYPYAAVGVLRFDEADVSDAVECLIDA